MPLSHTHYVSQTANRRKRQSMSKLRYSNHSLAIETGRHKKIEVHNRLYLKCNVVEDEIHFLTKCKVFDTTKQKFLKELVAIDSAFSNLDYDNLFTKRMTNNNCLIVDKLIPFITACFEIRRISFIVISQ